MEGLPSVSRSSLVILPFYILFLFGAPRTSVTLAWDPPRKTSVIHYRIYYTDMTKAKAAKANWIDVGRVTQASLPNLVLGHTYYFVVTVFNSAGRESQPSNLVKYVAGASPPLRKPIKRSAIR
jgi:Fibronectin type III domain